MNSRLKLIQATFLFRDILRILNIRKSIIVSLVIAFGVLATLEMLGLFMFASLIGLIYQNQELDRNLNEKTIHVFNFQLELPYVVLLVSIILVSRSILSLLVTRKIYDYFSRMVSSISIKYYNHLFDRGFQDMNLIGYERAYALLSYGSNSMIYGTVISFLTLIGDLLFVAVALSSLVFLSDIKGLFALTSLIVASVIILAHTRNSAEKFGFISSSSMEKLGKIAKETWGLRREIRVTGSESHFRQKFQNIRVESAISTAKLYVLGYQIRTSMEVLSLVFIFGAVSFFMFFENSASGFVSLGISILVVTRITPVLLRVQNTITNLFANNEYSNQLVSTFQQFGKAEVLRGQSDKEVDLRASLLPKPKLKSGVILKTVDLDFVYPQGNQVLMGINLEIKIGETIFLFGKSGSGKSTLLDLLSSTISPSSGWILRKPSMSLGYVPQEVLILEDTIINNLLLGREMSRKYQRRVEEMIQDDGLLSFVSEFTDGVQEVVGGKFGKLSGGQKQLIGLARATLDPVDLLLLDEPTNSLDKRSFKILLNQIKQVNGSGKSCVIASHDEKLVESRSISGTKIHLSKGAIVNGTSRNFSSPK